MFCPVQSPQWQDLLSSVNNNRDRAYYMFTINGGTIPSPPKARILEKMYTGELIEMKDIDALRSYKGEADNSIDALLSEALTFSMVQRQTIAHKEALKKKLSVTNGFGYYKTDSMDQAIEVQKSYRSFFDDVRIEDLTMQKPRVIVRMSSEVSETQKMRDIIATNIQKTPSLAIQRRVENLMKMLAKKTGMSYKVIEREEMELKMRELGYPADSPTWSVTHDGIVYVVRQALSEEIAFHEFAHPIIESIRLTDPVGFKDLYESIWSLTELPKDWIDEQKKDIESNSHYPKESDRQSELIARAVGYIGQKAMYEPGYSGSRLAKYMEDIFQRFLSFINKYFGTKYSVSNANNKASVRTIMDAMLYSESIPIPRENYISGQTYFMSTTAENMIKEHGEINKTIHPETDTQTYQKQGDPKEYGSVTYLVNKEFTDFIEETEKAQNRAKKTFKNQSKSHETDGDFVLLDDVSYTYEELWKMYLEERRSQPIPGRIIHAYVSWLLTTDEIKKKELMEGMRKEAALLGDPDKELKKILEPLQQQDDNGNNRILAELVRRLDLKTKAFNPNISDADADLVMSEIQMINEQIQRGTTTDLLIARKNGSFALYDFKTGSSYFSTRNSEKEMKYSDELHYARQSHEDIAKMELAWRAFMLKQKYGKDFVLEDIKIIHISSGGDRMGYIIPPQISIVNVALDNYLGIIANYYKNNPDETIRAKYTEFKEQGLFDYSNYNTISQSILDEAESDHGKSIEELEEKYSNLLEKYNAILGNITREMNPNSLDEVTISGMRRKVLDLAMKLGSLRQSPDSTIYKMSHDIGAIKRYFGTMYDVQDPFIQNVTSFFRKRKYAKEKEYDQIQQEFDDLMWKVVKQKFPSTESKAGRRWKEITGYDREKLYQNMYVEKTLPTGKGKYLVTEADTQQWNNLSEEEKAVVRFVRKTWGELYDGAVGKDLNPPGYKKPTKKRDIYKRSDLPEKWEDHMMFRVPISQDEVIERNKGILRALGRKDYWKFVHAQTMEQWYDADTYYDQNAPYITRLKYIGSPEIIESELYSTDLEKMFKGSVDNLLTIKHMDPVISYALSLRTILEAQAQFPDIVQMSKRETEQIAGWLESFAVQNIMGQRKRSQLTSKPIMINGKRVNTDRFLLGIKNTISFVSLGLKPFTAGMNTALIIMVNTKKAISGSIAKRVGINPDDIDFTINDLRKAHALWAKLMYDMSIGNENNNKLWLLIKQTRFLSDNYDFKMSPNNLTFGKSKLADSSLFYYFHRIGENYGLMTTFAAMMVHMKNQKNGKSMYDSYVVKNGQLEWNEGLRGKLFRGQGRPQEDIYGLTENEISMMKDVTRRMHGNYRQEEKIAIEINAWGQLLMQFKKYMPAYLINLGTGRYQNVSLGRMKVTGQEDGVDIYRLIPETYKGGFRLMGNAMAFVLMKAHVNTFQKDGNKVKDWTPGETQKVIEMISTAAIMFAFYLFWAMGVDDDDKEKYRFKRLRRLFLEDLSQQAHPNDFLRNLTSPIVSANKLYDLFTAIPDYMWNGVIMGDRTNAGRLPGQQTIIKNIPIINIGYELDKYFYDNAPTESQGFLGYIGADGGRNR